MCLSEFRFYSRPKIYKEIYAFRQGIENNKENMKATVTIIVAEVREQHRNSERNVRSNGKSDEELLLECAWIFRKLNVTQA